LENDTNNGGNQLWTELTNPRQGEWYHLEFDYSMRYGQDNHVRTLTHTDSMVDIYFGGHKIGTLDDTSGDKDFEHYTYDFYLDISDSNLANNHPKLEFVINSSNPDDSYGADFDNIHFDLLSATGEAGKDIRLPDISASLNDTDGSESLKIEIADIEAGATISDGTNSFTATSGSTTVDVTNWNLNTLYYSTNTSGPRTDTLTIQAIATEGSNGDTAVTSQNLDVTILADTPVNHLTNSGVVIDGIVEGLYYETSSGLSGFTDGEGAFDYLSGDIVTFKIGNLVVGRIDTDSIDDGMVFLQDLAGTERSDMSDEYVENMAVLLQSLDDNMHADENDPIVITPQMHDYFIDIHDDLASMSEEDVATLIADIGREAISEDVAMDHVEDMMEYYNGLHEPHVEISIDNGTIKGSYHAEDGYPSVIVKDSDGNRVEGELHAQDGQWSFEFAGEVSEGDYTVTAIIRDTLGRLSVETRSLSVEIDTQSDSVHVVDNGLIEMTMIDNLSMDGKSESPESDIDLSGVLVDMGVLNASGSNDLGLDSGDSEGSSSPDISTEVIERDAYGHAIDETVTVSVDDDSNVPMI